MIRRLIQSWRDYWSFPSEDEFQAMLDRGMADWYAMFPDWYEAR